MLLRGVDHHCLFIRLPAHRAELLGGLVLGEIRSVGVGRVLPTDLVADPGP